MLIIEAAIPRLFSLEKHMKWSKKMDLYRTYWSCKYCCRKWYYDCNLDGFNCRCPECGRNTPPKTSKYMRSEPEDHTMPDT